jgi:dephospho-CoA kinase
MTEKIVLTLVGMQGAGKSEVAKYLQSKGFTTLRFGDLTDEELGRKGLPQTPENEELVRIGLRKQHGMGVFAVSAIPKIRKILDEASGVVIDGLYSWEEYLSLKKEFPGIVLVQVFAEKNIRHQRLEKRPFRPFNLSEEKNRDISEIETLKKAGPIAIADYLVDNSSSLEKLHKIVDVLMGRIRS